MPRPARPKRNAAAAPPSEAAATIAFRGTSAEIRRTPAAAVVAVRYDGGSLPPEDWRMAPDGVLIVTCPTIAFDAQPHLLEVEWRDDAAPASFAFRSAYHGAIEQADDAGISGWLYDALRPGSALTLEVASGGRVVQVLTTLPTPAPPDPPPGLIGGGFAVELPPRPADRAPELVTLTVRGSLHQPFAPILRGGGLAAAVATATAAGQALGRSAEGLLFGKALLPALVQALGGRGPALGPRVLRAARPLLGAQAQPRLAPPQVDVIVPVYRGRAETLACLESVLAAQCRIAHRVVVIDDASPEPELSAALRALGESGRVHYLRNDANLGFVASVNRGMALSPEADVLLLNADTVVPPGFLDRLYGAAASDPAIATVTPLSNNATVYSLPAGPGQPADPWEMDTAAIDAICRETNAGAVRDIPTAHGFCMFIKRAALDEVGRFDAASFGTGYGEENDFSLRALERGWRNVLAGDVYVSHRGEVSFAGAARAQQLAANLREVRRRYPYYEGFVADFIRADPLHDLRNNVQKAVWRRHQRLALFVTLALAGGAARHARDMMARLAEEGWLVLALAAGRNADGRATLTLRRAGSEEMLRYPAGAPQEAVLADILELAPRFIHVQHLIDLPEGIATFVRESGIGYAVTLHDFFYACPRVTLLDAGWSYCGMPPVEKCTACIRQAPIHAQIHPSLAPHAERGERWRAHWEGLLREAAQVIAPSQDTASRYAQLFPGLAVTVRPHPASPDLRPAPRMPPAPQHGLRVALPGALGPQKGVLEFVELARHCGRWHADIHFVVAGYTDREETLQRLDNVTVLGGYAAEDAVAVLAGARCRVALLLNLFPETFSYTLSESIAAGLVPVGFDFGAVGERIKALRTGIALPPGASPERIVAALRQAAALPPPAVAPPALYGQYRRMMEDYYAPALADLAEVSPPPDRPRLLAWPTGLQPDLWCDPVVTFAIWSAQPLARVALSLRVPAEGHLQAVEIAGNGARLTRCLLEDGMPRRILAALPPPGARLLHLTLRFDFVFRLAPPDIRCCAALWLGLQVGEGTGWLAVDLPEQPSRGAAA